jgi:uncharacterized protein with GYD domain
MRYVLLGTISPQWVDKQSQRLSGAKLKLTALGIKLTSVNYTQGQFDFVTIVEAPNPEAVLAMSVWYAAKGYGRIQSMPAFDPTAMQEAIKRASTAAPKKKS